MRITGIDVLRDIDVYIEQPCLSYEECLNIRSHCDHPFVLDEVINDVPTLLRAASERAMDVVNLKISKFGGLTRTRLARDLCVGAGQFRRGSGGIVRSRATVPSLSCGRGQVLAGRFPVSRTGVVADPGGALDAFPP